MTLEEKIREKINTTGKDTLLKAMGYHHLEKGRKRLDVFLEAPSIFAWLMHGSFDMKYDSKAFLKVLGKVLHISEREIEETIISSEKRSKELDEMEEPYIFVDTKFKRNNEPIFALAFMESKRRIKLDKVFCIYKSKQNILDEVIRLIQKHFEDNEGRLKLWGKIDLYVYHHIDGSRYIFTPDGKLLDDREEISESKAELHLGNKLIMRE